MLTLGQKHFKGALPLGGVFQKRGRQKRVEAGTIQRSFSTGDGSQNKVTDWGIWRKEGNRNPGNDHS